VIANFLFRERTISRRREQFGLTSRLQKVWLLVDEAHNFCPSAGSTLATEILVRWAKEGRQPGLSLVVATQQPAALSAEILTQCGIRIVHRLTAKEDFRAVDALSQDYLGEGIATRIRALSGPGQALVIDDQRETAVLVHIRPRQTEHGGGSA
jgi:DNA helicase HerA-like ATPase